MMASYAQVEAFQQSRSWENWSLSSDGSPRQGDSRLLQLTALGAGVGAGAAAGYGLGYGVAGLSVVCPVCGAAMGLGVLAYAGYELYEDYMAGFAGVRGFGQSIGNVLSGTATAGEALQVGLVGGGFVGGMPGARLGSVHARIGYEIPTSKTPGMIERIAPFGNRKNDPIGRFPHYHRRVPDHSRPGNSVEGQGIHRHRPFESRPTDNSFWDRF
jgi:hypothetical protein